VFTAINMLPGSQRNSGVSNDALLRWLKGEPEPASGDTPGVAVRAWDWGPLLVARHFWNEPGLPKTLDSAALLQSPEGATATC
jgi:hypothetical protein